MLVLLTARRLKPGTFEEWRRAWEPDEWPEQFSRAYVLRNRNDPDEVISFGVWEGSAEELRALHNALERPLLELGCYRREERGYTPHVTLGRVRAVDDPAALAAVVQQFAKWQGGQTQVREVLVMSSEIGPEGPEYTVLSRAKLQV